MFLLQILRYTALTSVTWEEGGRMMIQSLYATQRKFLAVTSRLSNVFSFEAFLVKLWKFILISRYLGKIFKFPSNLFNGVANKNIIIILT